MARENSFTFIGQVVNVPIVLLNEESNNYRITFTLLVVRRNGRTDYPKINVYDLTEQEARNYVQMMRPGVYAIIRGMIATNVVKKPVRCEICGEISKIDTLQTEVISFGKPYVMREKPKPDDVAEFSNRGIVLGSLCSQVFRRDGSGGGVAAQFQMAISRKYHTKDMSVEELCNAMKAAMTQISYTGLTTAGEGMTWTADGEPEKAPMAVVIKDGAYASMN